MLDQAFDALKTYDWGQDRDLLRPIDEAVVASHDNAAARQQLEDRLISALQADLPYDSKQFLCRKLMLIGSAASTAALANLLTDEHLSHMARYALERIPEDEAAAALRDALPNVQGELKIGVISSLGARGDEASVALLAELLADQDATIAQSAAFALGAIRSSAAATALADAEANAEAASAVADASLACAEAMLADGNAEGASAVYKRLATSDQPKHVKLAAARGMLALAGKK